MAPKLISTSQTAFIKNIFIMDGVVMLHEVVHELQNKKMAGIVFKIDFEKAYDNIIWNFVEEVMVRKGFSNVLRGRLWILLEGERFALTSMAKMGLTLRPSGRLDVYCSL